MDTEFAKWLITLGVGGVLAAFMFIFYRKDIQQYTDLWKAATDRLELVVKENTESNIKLIVLIENQKQDILKRQDIEILINNLIDRKLGKDN